LHNLNNKELVLKGTILLLIAILFPVSIAYAKPDRPIQRGGLVWFVNIAQTGSADGQTWDTAFDDLELAIDSATIGDQIWVATGTYLPSDTGGTADPRDASFNLVDGVSVYGGFDGTETNLSQRNPITNITILSGDLQQDDQSGGDNSDNAKHVVTIASTIDPATLLDGFRIRDGSSDPAKGGAGILIRNADSSVIKQCLFIGNNSATFGGAIYLEASTNISISTSWFNSNVSVEGGGAIEVGIDSDVSINSCNLIGNQSNTGGAIMNEGSIVLSNSFLYTNVADRGGALASNSAVGNCQVSNCTIAQNLALLTGGGVIIESGPISIMNTIVWGNQHLSGEDETAQIMISNTTYPIQIAYSCIQNMDSDLVGANNIVSNPRFFDLLGPDGERGTGDEDFRLLATSPCIDAADNTEVVGLYDLDGQPRFVDDPFTPDTGNGTVPIVDMGAYEYKPTGIADIGGIVIWNTDDGSFSDPTNWFPQRVPSTTDIALFNINGEAVVEVTENISVNAMVVTSGEISLRIPNIDISIDSYTNPLRILSFGDDSELEVSGENGRLIIPNGEIQIGGDDDDDDFDDFLEIDDGAELVVGMLRILDGGEFFGGVGAYGISADVRNTGGTIDPSSLEPGLMHLDGNYSSVPQDGTDPNAKGVMRFTFNDTSNSGYIHDVLDISGNATLGGVLGMQFQNNFEAIEGYIYTIITAGTMSGTFDTVWSTGLPANQFANWTSSTGIRGTPGGGIGSGNPITFDAPTSTALTGEPTEFVVADFDGVNGVDVAIAIPDSDPLTNGTVSVHLNNGVSGGIWQGFANATTTTVGINPVDIDADDFDGDGDIDLVVANFDDDTITTLFNDGSASFTLTNFATGDGPSSLAITNYVEDGTMLNDIAVGCSVANPAVISVMQNQSTPGLLGSSFNLTNSITIPNPTDIDPSDVDNNKDFDYVVLSGSGESVSVYEGNGNGGVMPGFTIGITLPSGSSPVSQVFGDLNGDGRDDLITVNNGDGSVSILRNTGSALDTPSTLSVGSFPEALTIKDLDNDGDQDIVVSVIGATSLQRELLIARNDTTVPETITLTDIGTPQASGYVPTLVSTGDFDADGFEDLVSITELVPLTGHTLPSLTVMINTTVITCSGDFDVDGDVDISDLLTLIAAWGATGGDEDLDGGGTVDVADLLILIAAWGSC
jgi:predicted outer membrane repeat protein